MAGTCVEELRSKRRRRDRRLDERAVRRPAVLRRRGFDGRRSTSGPRASLPAAAPASWRSRRADRGAAAARHRPGRPRRRGRPTRKILDVEGRLTVCEFRCPADLDRLGAALSAAARCVSGGALPSQPGAQAFRAGRPRGDGALFRRQPPSRPIFWSAADGIRSTVRQQLMPDLVAALCRLCGVALADPGERAAARDPSRAVRIHGVLPAARRAVPELSGGRAGQRPAGRPAAAERDLVPAGRRAGRIAAASHRRKRRRRIRSRSRRRSSASRRAPDMRAAAERLVAPQMRALARLMTSRCCSRSTIWRRRGWRSAGWRSSAMRPSWRGPHVGAGVSKAADDVARAGEGAARSDDVAAGAATLRGRAAPRRPARHRARAISGAYLQAHPNRRRTRACRAATAPRRR